MTRLALRIGIAALFGCAAAALAFAFTQRLAPNASIPALHFVKPGRGATALIEGPERGWNELSFFCRLRIPGRLRSSDRVVLLADAGRSFSFELDGSLGLVARVLGRTSMVSYNELRSRDSGFSLRRSNQLGFVFDRGELGLYVNGALVSKLRLDDTKIMAPDLELLPAEAVGAAMPKVVVTYPVLAAQALTLQHIADLKTVSARYDILWSAIILLALGAALFAFALVAVLGPALRGLAAERRVLSALLYTVGLTLALFVFSGLGHRAARFVADALTERKLEAASLYFTGLSVLGLAFAVACALERCTQAKRGRGFVVVLGAVSLLLLTVGLAALPRSEIIRPIVFDLLFGCAFAVVSAAPVLLGGAGEKNG